MNRKLLTCGLLLLALGASGTAQVASHAPTSVQQDPPVARVNGVVLTNADLVREEYAIFPYARQHRGLPKEMEAQIRAGALKMMVFEELVYQEAERRHMTIPPATLDKAEADFRAAFSSPDAYNAFVATELHGSRQLLRAKIRRSLLIDRFLKIEVEDRSAVSLTEARAFYVKNPAQFRHPESYTFQTISILPPEHPTAAQLSEGRRRADDALRQAKTTKSAEDFGLLAEKISDDDYRVMMGQHRPVPADQLAPPVLQALQGMRAGQISGLIQLQQAFTIVRLEAHTPAGEARFQDVQTQLRKELYERKRNALRAALDRKLRQNATVQEF
jgi:hypothetical protein